MTGLLFALIACLLTGIGARDQVTVAGLAARQGARPGLLIVGWATSIATAAFATFAAIKIAPLLSGNARTMVAGRALLMAGAESLLLAPKRLPDEPTSSLGATALVLLAHQLTDSTRFLIFAIAVATGAALPAGLGGAIGGGAVVTLAWAMATELETTNLRPLRRVVGLVLLGIGAWLVLRALGRA